MKKTIWIYVFSIFLLICAGVALWRKKAGLRREIYTFTLKRDRGNRIWQLFTRSVPIGSIAQSFKLPSYEDEMVTFRPTGAKLSMLIFFNPTDCTWCLLEASLWREIDAKYSPEELKILGITTSVNLSEQEVLLFKKGRKLSFPILRCEDEELIQAYGITNTPTRILVDESGRIIDAGYSTHSPTIHRRLKEKIALLLQADL